MKSVPPRGSGWVSASLKVDCQNKNPPATAWWYRLIDQSLLVDFGLNQFERSTGGGTDLIDQLAC